MLELTMGHTLADNAAANTVCQKKETAEFLDRKISFASFENRHTSEWCAE